jgi:hypothetical protein
LRKNPDRPAVKSAEQVQPLFERRYSIGRRTTDGPTPKYRILNLFDLQANRSGTVAEEGKSQRLRPTRFELKSKRM